jgi:hypothetical protein
MNATEMRKLADQAIQRSKVRAEVDATEAEAKRREAAKRWWMDHGIRGIFKGIRQAAERGDPLYRATFVDCPDYVVKYIKDRGFEVERSSSKRAPLEWVHTLTVGW